MPFASTVMGPRTLAAAAAAAGVPLIHISTDYVYDGAKPSPYVETDAPHPHWSLWRLEACRRGRNRRIGGDYVILRTSWVCSPDGNNFVKTMLRLAAPTRRNRGRGRSMGSTDLCRRSGRGDCFDR